MSCRVTRPAVGDNTDPRMMLTPLIFNDVTEDSVVGGNHDEDHDSVRAGHGVSRDRLKGHPSLFS